MRQNKMLALWLAIGGLSALLFGGCAAKEPVMTPEYVRKHIAPEMDGIALTREQRKNVEARTRHDNLRQIPDDLAYILLLERPGQMSRYIIP
ncbi:MAG: hypothetical protein IT440_15085 [Phycisphaeraceae bacterium]|nr:hypothetical protein [Phycisphaeraceae bacterium]